MTTVSQILEHKGSQVTAVAPQATVLEAIKQMADENIGSLAVVEHGVLVGIFTERHYARRVFLRGKASPDTLIKDVMSKNPICVVCEQTAEECMALMTDKAIRHLPVLKDNQMVGIISIGDLVKCIIRDQKFMIDQLEHYIHGAH